MKSVWKRAKKNMSSIALAESLDQRVLRAAAIAAREQLAHPILIGSSAKINDLARELEVDLRGVEVHDITSSKRLSHYADMLWNSRKHKGMMPAEARDLAGGPLYYSALMVASGDADGVVAGAATPTAEILKAFIYSIGRAEGVEAVSSAFLMIVPRPDGREKVFIFADPSVIPDPTPEELAGIAIASARTRRLLVDDEPYVAMLSFSTKGSAQHESIEKVVKATHIAKKLAPDLIIDGELQADAAIVPDIARRKAPGSPVAGKANVLVFPDLDSANIGYKLIERLAGAKAIGPLLQGLKKPASDLSRGCRTDDIVNAIAMTAVQKEIAA